jgi:hypothetical protein
MPSTAWPGSPAAGAPAHRPSRLWRSRRWARSAAAWTAHRSAVHHRPRPISAPISASKGSLDMRVRVLAAMTVCSPRWADQNLSMPTARCAAARRDDSWDIPVTTVNPDQGFEGRQFLIPIDARFSSSSPRSSQSVPCFSLLIACWSPSASDSPHPVEIGPVIKSALSSGHTTSNRSNSVRISSSISKP